MLLAILEAIVPYVQIRDSSRLIDLCFILCSEITSGKHVRVMNTPLIPHFYIVKLGFAGVYLLFLFLLQNIDCGYSLEPPRRGGSNVYPQSIKHRLWVLVRTASAIYVLSKNKKNIKIFLMKFSIFTGEKKISLYCMGVFS